MQDKKPITNVNETFIESHKFLQRFLDKSEGAKRGSIPDFVLILVTSMMTDTFENIDNYLSPGHSSVDGREIVTIIIETFQKVLDRVKRNAILDKDMTLQ
jgi:hypothetical protein